MKEKSALNPKTETNQEITVVPMFAPNMMLTDSARVISPVLTKLTAITVVEEDEKTKEVMIKPAIIPSIWFFVIRLNIFFNSVPKVF